MSLDSGVFTISLDFELYWGVRDSRSVAEYQENLLGVQKAIPALLELFDKENIRATWASVGFLFFKNVQELRNNFPDQLPNYTNNVFSPYQNLDEIETLDARLCFAPRLIKMIQDTKGQEIASHTFSHYYCLESGQGKEAFKADLLAAQKQAEKIGVVLSSLVFPRNQWNEAYLSMLPELGINAYRGNEGHYLYHASNHQGRLKRALRLLDSYINISGHHTYKVPTLESGRAMNLPASRFLRPYNKRLSFLDGLRLARIKAAMTYAAKHNQVFHLWWHPHNFGKNLPENSAFLSKILFHFQKLHKDYGMQSLGMRDFMHLKD